MHPDISPASRTSAGTERKPRIVSRAMGGTANRMVAMAPASSPMPMNTEIGSRYEKCGIDCITLSTGTSRASNHLAFAAASPLAQPSSAATGAATNTIDSVIMESSHTLNTARYNEQPPPSRASRQPPSLAPRTAKRPTSTTHGTAPKPNGPSPAISRLSLTSRGRSSQPDTVRVRLLKLNSPNSSSSLRYNSDSLAQSGRNLNSPSLDRKSGNRPGAAWWKTWMAR